VGQDRGKPPMPKSQSPHAAPPLQLAGAALTSTAPACDHAVAHALALAERGVHRLPGVGLHGHQCGPGVGVAATVLSPMSTWTGFARRADTSRAVGAVRQLLVGFIAWGGLPARQRLGRRHPEQHGDAGHRAAQAPGASPRVRGPGRRLVRRTAVGVRTGRFADAAVNRRRMPLPRSLRRRYPAVGSCRRTPPAAAARRTTPDLERRGRCLRRSGAVPSHPAWASPTRG
jgi:hypothetical protein